MRVAADAVAHALRELFAALAFVRRDVANVAVASLAPLARRDERGVAEGSAWAWDRFAARRGVAKRWPKPPPAAGDATRLAAALPRTSAWLAAATRAAHALDASIPSLAFETRDVAFRVPPNATSAIIGGRDETRVVSRSRCVRGTRSARRAAKTRVPARSGSRRLRRGIPLRSPFVRRAPPPTRAWCASRSSIS